jgi:hypothetical protein
MSRYRQKIERPCPKCGKIIKGTSLKHWGSNLKIHLIASIKHPHNMAPQEAIEYVDNLLRQELTEG